MSKFKVIQSNEKQEDKGVYLTKLQRTTKVADAIFGDKEKKETYYIKGTKPVAVGAEIDESALFPKYRVQEHPMVNPSTGEEFMGKWLHLA